MRMNRVSVTFFGTLLLLTLLAFPASTLSQEVGTPVATWTPAPGVLDEANLNPPAQLEYRPSNADPIILENPIDGSSYQRISINCPSAGCGSITVTIAYDCANVRYIGVTEIDNFTPSLLSSQVCQPGQPTGQLQLLLIADAPENTAALRTSLNLYVDPFASGTTTLVLVTNEMLDANLLELSSPPVQFIQLEIRSGALPTPVVVPVEQEIFVIVTVPAANLRSGPGLNYSIVGFATLGTRLRVIDQAVTLDGFFWYRIERPTGGTAWISAAVVNLTPPNSAGTIPFADVTPVPPPRPVPTPTPQFPTSVPPGGSGNPPTGAQPPVTVPSQPTAPSTTLDSDGDGTVDANDPCPFERGINHPTCPDNDADGVINAADPCPTQFGTAGGCPDGDQDGVADTADRCQGAAGLASNQGCPAGQRILPGSYDYPRKAEVRAPLVALTG
jgi:hypothetical protein